MPLPPDRWSQLLPDEADKLRSWPAAAHVKASKLAPVLGVAMATLETWRARAVGPRPEPRLGPQNTETFYSVAGVLAWLDNHQKSAWEYEKAWLIEHFDGWETPAGRVSESLSEAETAAVTAWFRAHGTPVIQTLGMKWPNPQPRRGKPDYQPAWEKGLETQISVG